MTRRATNNKKTRRCSSPSPVSNCGECTEARWCAHTFLLGHDRELLPCPAVTALDRLTACFLVFLWTLCIRLAGAQGSGSRLSRHRRDHPKCRCSTGTLTSASFHHGGLTAVHQQLLLYQSTVPSCPLPLARGFLR